jgi:hypothetical protein
MEPEITINGHKISNAMAMTIRVAIENFAFSLSKDGLDNESGQDISKLYLDRIIEIRKFMYNAKLTGACH